MKLNFIDVKVAGASFLGLAGPDVFNGTVDFFSKISPVLDGFVRLGQVGVATATIFYIFKKWKTVGKRPRKKKVSQP